MPARRFEDLAAQAVVAVWAASIPQVALYALWARSERAAVYAIARALSPRHRALALAWYASQDPQPKSPRAVRAATLALRSADRVRLPVVAMVPLKDPAVVRLASQGHDTKVRRALELRTKPESEIDEGELTHGLLVALHASALSRRGHAEEARSELAKALELTSSDAPAQLALLHVIRDLSAWSAIPSDLWSSESLAAAAFVAGQSGESAVMSFHEVAKSSFHFVPATFGAGTSQVPWRDQLQWNNPHSLDELYQEGLISTEELWTIRFGAALVGPAPDDDVAALLAEAISQAHSAAQSYSENLLRCAQGTGSDDNEHRRDLKERLLARVATSLEQEKKPHWRGIRPVMRLARKAASCGGAPEVRTALDTLEKSWGPASTWGRESYGFSETIVEHTAELCAWAEGRSLDAYRMHTEHNLSDEALCASIAFGLARDGEIEPLRELFGRLVSGPMEPKDVLLVASAAVALEPNAETAVREATRETLASLPESQEAVSAWLKADLSDWDAA